MVDTQVRFRDLDRAVSVSLDDDVLVRDVTDGRTRQAKVNLITALVQSGTGGGGWHRGTTPPANPNVGDAWYKTDSNDLRFWSGSAWIVIGPADLNNVTDAEARRLANQALAQIQTINGEQTAQDNRLTALEGKELPDFPAEGDRDNKVPKFDGNTLGWELDADGGGGGLSDVTSDATLSGNGTSSSPLSVTTPFTASEKTKLGGVQAGAQVNRTPSETVSAIDGNIGNGWRTKASNADVDAVPAASNTRDNLTNRSTYDDIDYLTVRHGVRLIERLLRKASTTVLGTVLIARNEDVQSTETDTSRVLDVDKGKALISRIVDLTKLNALPTLSALNALLAGKVDTSTFNTSQSAQDSRITAVEGRPQLPAFPSGGQRDNKVPKFNGDSLEWELDTTSGQGLSHVSTDSTINGDGTSESPLAVATPFTSTEKTKLAGIPANANHYDDAAADRRAALRYTNAEKGKLAGIEDHATADQSNVEIRDSLESLTGNDRLDASAIKNIPATGGGLTSVATDSTLTGDGTSGNTLKVAVPYSTTEKTKLAGIPANANHYTDSNADARAALRYTNAEKSKLAGIASGATSVQANPAAPFGAGRLTAIEISGSKYYLLPVEGNPSDAVDSGNLTKLKIGSDVYAIPAGGGGGTAYKAVTYYISSDTKPGKPTIQYANGAVSGITSNWSISTPSNPTTNVWQVIANIPQSGSGNVPAADVSDPGQIHYHSTVHTGMFYAFFKTDTNVPTEFPSNAFSAPVRTPQSVTMPTTSANARTTFVQPVDTPDLTQAIRNGVDLYGGFTKQSSTFNVNGVNYEWWIENRIQRAADISGNVWDLRR